MKRIAIFCVNYNTYEELDAYMRSVVLAALLVRERASVDVFIADNTEDNIKIIDTNNDCIAVKVYAFHKNLGYFGAIQKMMAAENVNLYDYVIVSNVDLVLEKQTFVSMLDTKTPARTGWIAPFIYSNVEHRDRNPQIMNRYGLKKLRALRLLYVHPLLNYIYTKTLYRRKRYETHEAGQIYAGHGSFIILTREFFDRCGIIDYPVFLYGEEIYLAEVCVRNGLGVYYAPEIRILDMEHASTGKMPSSFYNKCNIESLDYIIRTFY